MNNEICMYPPLTLKIIKPLAAVSGYKPSERLSTIRNSIDYQVSQENFMLIVFYHHSSETVHIFVRVNRCTTHTHLGNLQTIER